MHIIMRSLDELPDAIRVPTPKPRFVDSLQEESGFELLAPAQDGLSAALSEMISRSAGPTAKQRWDHEFESAFLQQRVRISSEAGLGT